MKRSLLRIARETTRHGIREPPRDPLAHRLDGGEARLEHRREKLELGELVVERRAPEEELADEEAGRVDVGAGGDRIALYLLGRHVPVGPLHGAGERVAGDADDLGEIEVAELHEPVPGDEHVGGTHVAMDDGGDLARAGILRRVGGGERGEDARPDVHGDAVAERLAANALPFDELREREAVDVLEDEREVPLVGEEVEELDDGWVSYAGVREGLGGEDRLAIGIVLTTREQALDDHAALEVPGEQARGKKHLALPSEA